MDKKGHMETTNFITDWIAMLGAKGYNKIIGCCINYDFYLIRALTKMTIVKTNKNCKHRLSNYIPYILYPPPLL